MTKKAKTEAKPGETIVGFVLVMAFAWYCFRQILAWIGVVGTVEP
jgi:hypothetical protein